VLGCALLVYGVEFSARTWLFYNPVRTLGLDPRRAGAVLLVCGGLGLVGFRLGGWLSDRWGRRGAFAASSGLFALSSAGYYGLSSHAGAWTVPVLGLSLLGLSTGGNAAVVAFRSLATELFPTRLRGTLAGWTAVCSALGWCGAMLATSWLSDALGGIGPAVTALILVALPAAALALAPLPETAGLDLEVAAMEG
jgi:MFS family permease